MGYGRETSYVTTNIERHKDVKLRCCPWCGTPMNMADSINVKTDKLEGYRPICPKCSRGGSLYKTKEALLIAWGVHNNE